MCHENDTAGIQILLGSRPNSVSEMLFLGNERGWTALHIAVFMNRVEMIKILASFFPGFLERINTPG
jgi:ankyrin repeat protein